MSENRTIAVPASADEWLATWNSTHHLDGLLGLLHGIWRIRPEKDATKYMSLVSLLVDHAKKVVQTHSSTEEQALGPWQEIHKKAYERLVFLVMGRRLVPMKHEFETSHGALLEFLSEGPIGIFSGREHLEAVERYLSSLVTDDGGGSWWRLCGEDYRALCDMMTRLSPVVVRAACAWGLAFLFIPRKNQWLTPAVARKEMVELLNKANWDPETCLHPHNFSGLGIPHHIPSGQAKEFGLYRTSLVVMMLDQFLRSEQQKDR